MKRALFLLLSLCSAASAQTIQQSGTVTPGHALYWVTNGVAGDAGTAPNGPPSGGGLTDLLVTKSGPGICQNSGPVTGAYNQLCFNLTSTGGGFTFSSFGGASGTPTFTLNGTAYQFPFTPPAGGVQGPISSTVGHLASFNNGAGNLLADSGIAASSLTNVVNGPGSSTVGHVALFNNTAGTLLSDSGNAIGTSGATIPLNNTANVFSSLNIFSAGIAGGSSSSSSLLLESTTGTGTTDFISFKTGSQVEAARINSAGDTIFGSNVSITDIARVNIYTPAGLQNGISITQNGLASSPTSGTCTGCLGNGFTYNFINIASDNVNAVTGGGTQGAVGVAFQMNSGGSNTAGERSVLYISNQLLSADNTSSNAFPFYIGWVSQTASAINDGGTIGTPRGQLFGFNPQVILKSGATNWDTIAGAEIDVSALTGSSVNFKYGFNVVDEGQVHATTHEWAYGVSSSIGWKIGFAGDDFNFGTSPIASNGTFIGTDFSGGPYTIGTGIDLTGFTGASNALAIKSHNFGVGWVGDVQLRHVEGLTVPTASSCPGFSLSSQSSDLGGSVTMNSATSCTIAFGQTYLFAPFCVVTPVTTTAAVGVSTNTTTMSAFFGASQTQFNYVCIGV